MILTLHSCQHLENKQLRELPPILTENDYEWLENIVDKATNEANKGKAVLIINETIGIVKVVKERMIKKGFPK
jgi:hypothetical protein